MHDPHPRYLPDMQYRIVKAILCYTQILALGSDKSNAIIFTMITALHAHMQRVCCMPRPRACSGADMMAHAPRACHMHRAYNQITGLTCAYHIHNQALATVVHYSPCHLPGLLQTTHVL